MHIVRFLNSPVESNAYVIYTDGCIGCIVVDPGNRDVSSITEFLDAKNLVPEYVVLSHEHFDHTWGVNALKCRYGSKIVCSKACADKLAIPQNYFNLLYYNDSEYFCVKDVDIVCEANITLNWMGYKLVVYDTPGHTDGSICLYIGNNLFTGDTMIYKTKPLLKKRHGASKEAFCRSLKILLALPDDTLVYPGHGEVFNLADTRDWYQELYRDYLGESNII